MPLFLDQSFTAKNQPGKSRWRINICLTNCYQVALQQGHQVQIDPVMLLNDRKTKNVSLTVTVKKQRTQTPSAFPLLIKT